MRSRIESASIYQQSLRCMPGGVSSPVRSFKGLNMEPMIACRGKGDHIWDADGHAYIDYCLGWGSLMLGHAPETVVTAAIEQMNRGSSFGIATPYELELANKIKTHLPSIEKIRFVSSGTEATMSAIRLARGYTSRSKVVKFIGHYHGHAVCLLIEAGSGVTDLPKATSAGIPEDMVRHTICLPFNEIETCRDYLRQNGDSIAAIILEPIAANMGVVPADWAFVQMLRQESAALSIVLIFDEVVTGFRVGLGGAQAYYGIVPDLTCLGKIIGGGFPVAAFGGKSDIMDHLAPMGDVYQAGTLSGNPVAMCAGYATLCALEQEGFYEALAKKTQLLTDPIEHWIEQNDARACLNRMGSMFTLFLGPQEVKSKADLQALSLPRFRALFTDLFEQGIYPPPSAYEAWFVSSAHTEEHLLTTRDVILSFLKSEGSL